MFEAIGPLKRNFYGLSLRFNLKLARKYYKQKKWDEAERYFKKCLSLDASHAEANLRLGQFYRNLGDKQKSLPYFETALSLLPQDTPYAVAASYELGTIEQSTIAIQFLNKFIKKYPYNLDALRVLAAYFSENGDVTRCIETFEKAISLGDEEQSTYLCLGDVYKQTGQLELARKYYRYAAESYPQSWRALTKYGSELQSLRNVGAEDYLQRSLALKFDQPDAHNNLGLIYLAQNKIYASIPHFRHAQVLEPANPISYINLANAYTAAGRLNRAQLIYEEGEKVMGDDAKIKTSLQSIHLYFIHCIYGVSPARIAHEHKAWGQYFSDANFNKTFNNDTQRNRALRIGYISPDLRRHSVFYFLFPIITNHDLHNIKTFCYANNFSSDQHTEKMKQQVFKWRDISSLSGEQTLIAIRDDNIDILVDLSGHTDRNSLILFAQRAAPIQVTYLGYPNTTGLASMDYRITDMFSDIPSSDNLYTESLLRLAGGFLCYQPDDDLPDITPKPTESSNIVVFGSFNTLAKVNIKVIDTWVEILKQVSNSVLMIKCKTFADEKVKKIYLRLFRRKGIATHRLEFFSWSQGFRGHLNSYNRVDIALDTFPYNGTTTTCEALTMGVPVITLAGDHHVARVGVSILTQLNLGELIANDTNDYIKRAVDLAHDHLRMADYRCRLREQFEQSPLQDSKSFCRSLETSFQKIWHDWCDSSESISLSERWPQKGRKSSEESNEIAVMYALPGAGSTLISKCLGCIEGNFLLSEINPKLSAMDPVEQFLRWANFLGNNDINKLKQIKSANYSHIMSLLSQTCRKYDYRLVVRDWTHVNFLGAPYVRYPSGELEQARFLGSYFSLNEIAISQHPVDQYLGMLHSGQSKDNLDVGLFLARSRQYAEKTAHLKTFKYEDFCEEPVVQLKNMTAALNVQYNDSFLVDFSSFVNVRGDMKGGSHLSEIKKVHRKQLQLDTDKKKLFEENDDYQFLIHHYGYI